MSQMSLIDSNVKRQDTLCYSVRYTLTECIGIQRSTKPPEKSFHMATSKRRYRSLQVEYDSNTEQLPEGLN